MSFRALSGGVTKGEFMSFRALQVFLYNFYSESGGVKLCVFQ